MNFASKVAEIDGLRVFYEKNTRATRLIPRHGEIDEFRYSFFKETKDHQLVNETMNYTVRQAWAEKFKVLCPTKNFDNYRKIVESVVTTIHKWQKLTLSKRERLSQSCHTSNGNSFGDLPIFGGKENVAPVTPKKSRGRPPKSANVSCVGTPMVQSPRSVVVIPDPSPSLDSRQSSGMKVYAPSKFQQEEMKTNMGGFVVPPSGMTLEELLSEKPILVKRKYTKRADISTYSANTNPRSLVKSINKRESKALKKEEKRPLTGQDMAGMHAAIISLTDDFKAHQESMKKRERALEDKILK